MEAGVGSKGGCGRVCVEGVVIGVVVAWVASAGLVVGRWLSFLGVVGETVVGVYGNWSRNCRKRSGGRCCCSRSGGSRIGCGCR